MQLVAITNIALVGVAWHAHIPVMCQQQDLHLLKGCQHAAMFNKHTAKYLDKFLLVACLHQICNSSLQLDKGRGAKIGGVST